MFENQNNECDDFDLLSSFDAKLIYQFIECAPNPILLHHKQKIIYANRECLKLFAASHPKQVIGQDIFNFIHPGYHQFEKERNQNLLHDIEKSSALEVKIISLNDKVFDVETISSTLDYPEEKLIQTHIRDISDTKKEKALIKEAQTRYKKLFYSAPDAYFICDARGNFIEWNERFELLVGYSKEELEGKSLFKSLFFPQDIVPHMLQSFVRIVMGEKEIIEELTFCHKNKAIIPIEIKLVSIRFRSTNYVFCLARDISQRYQAQTQLKESEIRLKNLSDATFEGIAICNGLEIVDVNYKLSEMLQCNFGELIGRSILDIFNEESHRLILDHFSSKNNSAIETKIKTQNLNCIPVEILSREAPHQDQVNRILAIRDISERKRLENLREDVERIVRHDLKNPLNGIIGFSQLLLMDDSISNENKSYLSHIYDNGKKMVHMINHSLDLFKMEEGTYKLKPANCNLTDILKKLNEDFANLLSSKNLKIKFYLNNIDFDWNQPIPIPGEKINLESLFSNLIRNAIEASPPDNKIELRLSRNDNDILIDIHNQGRIPEDVQENFFDRYATSGKKNGTGLGTYSALLIARSHGGDITFTTSENEGTHLFVNLPKS